VLSISTDQQCLSASKTSSIDRQIWQYKSLNELAWPVPAD
jgi:hypothetical protein